MMSPPATQETVFLLRATRWVALLAPNAASTAAVAMTPIRAVSLPENFCWTLSILSALKVATRIHPMDPRVMVQTALAKAISVMGSCPTVTPTA